MIDDIKVSIICLAYNQEKYIRQCLDGFIMQKTNFKFEVLIHDDASTDCTTDIIREYEQNYPNIINPVYQTENQYSKGVRVGATFLFPKIKGKYVATCDGDDYWTDPYKLQKQFDFMEANPDYSVCTHIVKRIYEPPILPDNIIPENAYEKDYSNITFEDVLKSYFQTSSYFFRWNAVNEVTIPKGVKYADKYILSLFAKYGKINFIPEIMSVYRCNPNGVYASLMINSDDQSTYISEICFDSMYLYKAIYDNIAIDKEFYFKNIYYPRYTYFQYFLLKGKKWRTFFALIYKNPDIYLLMLKHCKVMPSLIWQSTYRLIRKLYKVLTKKS